MALLEYALVSTIICWGVLVERGLRLVSVCAGCCVGFSRDDCLRFMATEAEGIRAC